MLSSFAPKLLVTLSFLAKKPSSKSVMPVAVYITKYTGFSGVMNRIQIVPKILSEVIKLGIFLLKLKQMYPFCKIL